MQYNIQELLSVAIMAAKKASVEILDVYHHEDFSVESKGDASPLTIADKRSHEVILRVLENTSIPILSEEGKNIPFEERAQWEYFWLIDPLDGTKEFIKKNGEFTVNIALIHLGKPIAGVVMIPVTGEIFYAVDNQAYVERDGEKKKLEKRSKVSFGQEGLVVVASRSHMNEETEAFLSRLAKPVTVSKGSSLKFLLVAEGKADIYPRFGPTMEWDTAAAHTIVNGVGLSVKEVTSENELKYNKENLLNPHFIVG